MKIVKGSVVKIKPEFQDEGDSDYIWTAITDENPFTGVFKVRITPINSTEYSMPHSVMELEALQVTVCES